MTTTVNIKAVLDGEPLEKCIRHSQPKIKPQNFKIGDHVTYRRQNREHEPLGLVRGIIESLTRTTCVMLDTATGEPVAASLDRVPKAGS
jgi:ABC-type uncharacterized transport system substrate-binding protein